MAGDPRLGEPPLDWEEVKSVRTPEDPLHFRRFKNRKTGEVVNGDPRLFPDALRERGVPITTFRLV